MPSTTSNPGLSAFLDNAGFENAQISFLAGDASFRKYYRISKEDKLAVLMDAPFPENPAQFIKIANYLRQHGINSPQIYSYDLDLGFILMEDFGDNTFSRLIAQGHDSQTLYEKAFNVITHLYQNFKDLPCPQFIPVYTADDRLNDCSVFLDWYWPKIFRSPISNDEKERFLNLWKEAFEKAQSLPKTLILRDYHVDNLILLKSNDVGVLDFQDAVWAPCVYELISLLEDARIDVDPVIQEILWKQYLTMFNDSMHERIIEGAAILAAGRHTRVIGAFTRLAMRDHKTTYLPHIPRVLRLLRKNLNKTPALNDLREWFEEHIFCHEEEALHIAA
jgi:aminoglycoside/choline kinase family phosphotransferase